MEGTKRQRNKGDK